MYADTPQFCHFITTAAMILHLTFSGRGAASLILYLTYYSKHASYKNCSHIPWRAYQCPRPLHQVRRVQSLAKTEQILDPQT